MKRDVKESLSDSFSILGSFLDLYSDRCTAHASFFVASVFGMFSLLNLFLSDTIENMFFPSMCYFGILFGGFYFLCSFKFYSDYSETIRQTFTYNNVRNVILLYLTTSNDTNLHLWLDYNVWRKWNDTGLLYIFYKYIRGGTVLFEKTHYPTFEFFYGIHHPDKVKNEFNNDDKILFLESINKWIHFNKFRYLILELFYERHHQDLKEKGTKKESKKESDGISLSIKKWMIKYRFEIFIMAYISISVIVYCTVLYYKVLNFQSLDKYILYNFVVLGFLFLFSIFLFNKNSKNPFKK